MNTKLKTSAAIVVVFGLGLFVCLTGCGKRTTPPGPMTFFTSASGMNITFLRWKEGLIFLFVDNVKGSHVSGGSGSTENPVRTQSGSAGDLDAGGYQWQIQTTDGNSASCRINEKDYDLSEGSLFVLNAKGEQVEVNQLKRDLSTIPFDVDGCKEPLAKDTEIRKVLELSDRSE